MKERDNEGRDMFLPKALRLASNLWLLSAGIMSGSLCMAAGPPSDEQLAAMMFIAGVTDAEELDESTVEEFSSYLSAPLPVNAATLSRLSGSGLFSQYQVASLLDYRSRSGDVLSMAELAAIDGFGKEYAAALSHFISLDSYALPGRSSAHQAGIRNSAVLRDGVRRREGERAESSYALRYRLDMRQRAELGFVVKSGYGESLLPPEVMSFNLSYYGRKRLGKLILGDFNARFGQGLAFWSGFSMGGLSAPESYSRRPSGIAPYRSYSGEGSLRGAAADFSFGRFTLTSFLAVEGLREMMAGKRDGGLSLVPAVNLGYFGRNGQASFTCYAQTRDLSGGPGVTATRGFPAGRASVSGADRLPEGGVASAFEDLKCSADMRLTVKGTEIFTEVALDVVSLSVAAVAGSRFSIGDRLDMAVSGRYYPAGYSVARSGAVRSGTRCSNEYALSVGGSFSVGKYVRLAGKEGFGSSIVRHRGVFGIDFSHAPEPRYGTSSRTSQVKMLFDYDLQLSPSVAVSMRATERLRDWGEPFRTDVRADVKYASGKFVLSARANVLLCEGVGLLGYAEGGYVSPKLTLYLRGGVFRIDNWDDRIYVYERDAPGSFNVPAFYGRGYWAALTASLRCSGWCRAYFRASFQDCPWVSPGAAGKRPGKAELKIQLTIDL